MLEQEAEAIRRKAEAVDKTPVHIALFGQPGSGKSSIINAIVGEPLAQISPDDDGTREKADYPWNGLFLTDLPGYGTTKFPASNYFKRFGINEFDLFLCVSSGRLLENDVAFFKELITAKKKCIFVRNQIDTIPQMRTDEEKTRSGIIENIRNQVGSNVDVVLTSCLTMQGLDELVKCIAKTLPSVKKERFLRASAVYSKDFLDQKREACLEFALYCAVVSATVNIVPIPALGFSADLTNIIVSMDKIRSDFHINSSKMDRLAIIMPNLAPAINAAMQYATKEGASILVNRLAASGTVVEISKYIPVAGTVIAGFVSFGAIYTVLRMYINDCYNIASGILDSHIQSHMTSDAGSENYGSG